MLPHPLTYFEIQKHYPNEPKFNVAYSRNNLPKIKEGAYVINLDEFKSIWTHWKALYVNAEDVTYFDSLGVELIPKEIRKFIGNKNIITNIYRIQAYDSVMCEYFFIVLIDFMLKGKTLWKCTNLISPNDYEKNDKIISKHFQENLNKLKCIVIIWKTKICIKNKKH